jgi:epoxyqueuosine reductase
MDWMADRQEMRADPRLLWSNVRSILLVGSNYGPQQNPLALLEKKDRGVISVYAQGRDYHDVIKGKLKALAGFLHARTKNRQSEGAEVKVFVDTAPVMEKPLAQAAGLGWQGKHTVLVSRDFGNWLFLGAIFTNVVLEPDTPETDHCGSCQKCLAICPTQAFPEPYVLDARRCIAYLTIEHKGPIPLDLRPLIGNRIFGCDDCLAVCPWNKFAQAARETKLTSRPDIAAMPLKQLACLNEAEFRSLFAGTPVRRAGFERFLRNVLTAIGNSADPALLETARDLASSPLPLVQDAALWAIERLERFSI